MAIQEPQGEDGERPTRGRGIAASEAMRSRAGTVGGLLAIAAAACLLGVMWQGDRFADRTTFPLFVATGIAYVLAVALFLAAALTPARRHSKALTPLTVAGTVLAVLALLGTFGTAVFSVLAHHDQTVLVHVRQSSVLHDLRRSCSGLTDPFRGRLDVQELDRPVVHILVACRNGSTTFILPSADLVVVD